MTRARRHSPADDDDLLLGWVDYGGTRMFVVDLTAAGLPIGLVEDASDDDWLDDRDESGG